MDGALVKMGWTVGTPDADGGGSQTTWGVRGRGAGLRCMHAFGLHGLV